MAPAETLARVAPLQLRAGITRVANITGLDRLGIPTAAAYRPNSRSIAVSQGKGLDLAAAKASAVMEAIEAFHAERTLLPLKLASYAELRRSHTVANVADLPGAEGSPFHARLPLLWTEGHDLLDQGPVWVPYELVHLNYTLPLPQGSGCFFASSNGLASGNLLVEAICHAIGEVVERDALTLWELQDEARQEATRIDLETVDDAACLSVLQRFERAGVAAAVWEITSDVGLPAFHCLIGEREASPLHLLHGSHGTGCHPSRPVALLRALTEAAQVRLTVISGARESLTRRSYRRRRDNLVLERERARLVARGRARPFHDGPSFDGETFQVDLAWMLARLQAAGLERVVAVDLTRPDFGVPVVRVVVPGLEGPASRGCTLGRRARMVLEHGA